MQQEAASGATYDLHTYRTVQSGREVHWNLRLSNKVNALAINFRDFGVPGFHQESSAEACDVTCTLPEEHRARNKTSMATCSSVKVRRERLEAAADTLVAPSSPSDLVDRPTRRVTDRPGLPASSSTRRSAWAATLASYVKRMLSPEAPSTIVSNPELHGLGQKSLVAEPDLM